MATVERVKGRIERLHIAMQKSEVTRERMAEYEGSIGLYKAMLIAQIGPAKADEFFKGLDLAPPLEN